MQRIKIAGVLTLALLLVSCARNDKLENTQNFWQRTQTDSALAMTGPKAQHTLHQDISACVVELRELQRLGSIRDAIPTDTSNQVPDYNADNAQAAIFDTPDRDGPLYAQYYDYVDFEGCMREKGWDRAVAITPRQQFESQDNWIRSLLDPEWGGGGAKAYETRTQRDAEALQKPAGYNN